MKINSSLDNMLYEYALCEVKAANRYLLSECTEADVQPLIKHLTRNKYIIYNYKSGKFERVSLEE